MAIDLKKLLTDIRSDDDDMRVLALRTIKRLNEGLVSRNIPLVCEIRDELAKFCSDDSDEVRFFASQSLDYLNGFSLPVDSVELDSSEMQSNTSVALTYSSSEPSFKSGVKYEPKTEKALRFLAKGTSKPGKAIAALTILSDGVDERHLPVVIKYLRFKVAQVRLAAVKVIVASGNERLLLESLLPHINDRSPEVREACLEAITSIDSKSLFTAIETMLCSKQVNVKVAAVFILAHMQGEEVISLLDMASRDKNEEVRSRVVDALKGR
jgi:HEAT repeat protein